jgi:predicted Zn-dependent protease
MTASHPFPRLGTLTFALLLAACQQPATHTPQVSAEELAKEEAYQQRMVEEVRAKGGMPKNWRTRPGSKAMFERVAGRIEDAGAAVCQDMGLPAQKRSCYYYFQMSTGQDINASADGQNVIINMGLLRFVNGDDELAGVMGHEVAHNLMAHRRSKQVNALIGQMIGAALDGAAYGGGVNTYGDFQDAGAFVGGVGYSPDFEMEADYVGLYIAARAGYDIKKMPQYWRRLSIAEPDSMNGGLTHPSNPTRFIAIQKTIDEITYKRKRRIPLIPDYKPV